MSNMSYCRFENTANDLQDCLDHIDDEADEDLSSDYERAGKRKLIRLCKEIASMFPDDEE